MERDVMLPYMDRVNTVLFITCFFLFVFAHFIFFPFSLFEIFKIRAEYITYKTIVFLVRAYLFFVLHG